MIARLRGRLDTVEDDHLVIDVGGVGYLVYCPQRIVALLPAVGEAVDLHVETVVREESITLYGFTDPAERSLFRMLQTVQGVGARVALAVLSALSLDELRLAVARQDKAALGRASGVGARLAQRIVTELRDRLDRLPAGEIPPGHPAPPAGGLEADAISALVNLGYPRSDAQRAIARSLADAGPDARVDALIRAALRELGPA